MLIIFVLGALVKNDIMVTSMSVARGKAVWIAVQVLGNANPIQIQGLKAY